MVAEISLCVWRDDSGALQIQFLYEHEWERRESECLVVLSSDWTEECSWQGIAGLLETDYDLKKKDFFVVMIELVRITYEAALRDENLTFEKTLLHMSHASRVLFLVAIHFYELRGISLRNEWKAMAAYIRREAKKERAT